MRFPVFHRQRSLNCCGIAIILFKPVLLEILLFCAGGPLLLMELAFLLRQVGCQVVWITNQRPEGTNDVSYSLEHKMLNHGVQVWSDSHICFRKSHLTVTNSGCFVHSTMSRSPGSNITMYCKIYKCLKYEHNSCDEFTCITFI